MIEPKDIGIAEWKERGNPLTTVVSASVRFERRIFLDDTAVEKSSLDIKAMAIDRLRRQIWDDLYGEIERRLSYCASAEAVIRDVLQLVRYPQEPVNAVAVERSAERIEHADVEQLGRVIPPA